MKTKLAYVLVSTEKDFYLEQAYVSMLSAKHHNPEATITLIVDRSTSESFEGFRKQEADVANEIVVVDLDRDFSAKKRSRILKTNLRNYITGDFLFIDCDTIVVKPLDEIDSLDASIAAVWDSHCRLKENPYASLCLKHGRRLGWPIDAADVYFNSGVVYAKDNRVTRDFYSRWHQNYLEGNAKNVFMDQPAFAKTNYLMGNVIQSLDGIWNCQVKLGIRYLRDAKIWHYLTTNKNGTGVPFLLNSEESFREIKRRECLPEQVYELFDNPFAGISEQTLLLSGDNVRFGTTYTFKHYAKAFAEGSFVFRMQESFFYNLFRLSVKLKGR